MKNTSGYRPLGRAVLTEPYEIKTQTIILPEGARERDAMVEQRVRVVDVGPEAWIDESQPRAGVGDRVMVSRYAGYMAIGPADGKRYRVVNDRDIFLQITDEGAENG